MADGSVTIDTKLDTDGVEKGTSKLKNSLNKIGSIATSAFKGATIAIGAVATGLTAIVATSVKSYASLEQNIGGVKTLFTDLSTGISSAETVIANANKAFKTAQISANEYMETVTSFSAALKQSVGSDMEAMAKYADMAVIDMADNANKMGTDMSLIQSAYQGFAKQNYTMLDNLKLGYGGTKTEMERLIADANKVKEANGEMANLSIESFADMVEAIHIIQTELGIAETSSTEAATTILGSVNSVKAAWDNFLNGSGTVDDLIEMIVNAGKNISTAIVNLAPNIVDGMIKLINALIPQIPELLNKLLPVVIKGAIDIINGLAVVFPQILQVVKENLPTVVEGALTVVEQFLTTILEMLPEVLDMGVQLLVQLINGLTKMLPKLIPVAVSCIYTLVDTLIENIDKIIDAALELIIALTDGLIAALPIMVEKVPTIINKLVTKLTDKDMIEKIIYTAAYLIVELAKGLIKAIPELLKAVPTIAQNLLNGLGNALSGVVDIGKQFLTKLGDGIVSLAGNLWNTVTDIGKNVVEGLWNGISGMWNWVVNKVSGWASGILDTIKGIFGIHSPSKKTAIFGGYLAEGLGVGFDKEIDSVYDAMQRTVDRENAKLTSNLTSTHQINVITEDNRQATLKSIDDNKEVIVNTTTNLDGKVIAEETNKINTRRKLQYGLE